VKGLKIKVSDVATVSGIPAAAVHKIENTVIAVSPLPGRTIKLNKYSVRKQISYKYGVVQMDGAEVATVKTAYRTYKSSRYMEYAKSAILAQLDDSYREIILAPVGVYRDLELPLGKVSLEMTHDSPKLFRGRAQVSVRILINGEFYTMQPLWFKLSGKRFACVAKTNIDRMQNISFDMVSSKLVDISALSANPIQCRNEMGNTVATQNITSGSILTGNNTQHSQMVLQGQDVNVSSRSGAITISIIATALQNGKKGDLIKLKNKHSKRVFLGEITGAHSARSL